MSTDDTTRPQGKPVQRPLTDQELEGKGLVRLCVVENQFEAQLIRGELDDDRIPNSIETYHETALDGLFTLSRGWGAILVRQEDMEKAQAIAEAVRASYAEKSEDTEE